MNPAGCDANSATRPQRFSYYFMVGLFVALAWLHLGVPFLSILFTYLLLQKLHWRKRGGKWLPVAMLLVIMAVAAYAAGYLIDQTVRALPDMTESAVQSIIQAAQTYKIQLPFSDYESLKALVLEKVQGEVHYIGSAAKFARGAGTEIVLLFAGCIVAMGFFLNPRFHLETGKGKAQPNLYTACVEQLTRRFTLLFQSFALVMGAQVVISAINTVLTAIFVLVTHLPNGVVVVGLTFVCGLLPVVGNLIGTMILVGIGFTVSPKLGLIALGFLVVIHKLEYFLNSKIVGHRLGSPLWLTLLALIAGERLMGIPGMILAPVVLHYMRLEAASVPVMAEPGPGN